MSVIHFRDDKLVGGKLNEYFGRTNIDYTEWECWQTGSLCWALHSYIEYLDGNLLSKFGVELAILNEDTKSSRQITRKMIKLIGREVFKDSRIHRLTALISPENRQATKFVKVVGFTHEGTLRKVDKNRNIDIYSIFEDEYRARWEK